MDNPEFFAIAAVATLYVIILCLAFAFYLFDAIVTAVYAKKHGVKNYGLAFLPIGKEYVMGTLAEQYTTKGKVKRNLMGLAIAFFVIPVVYVIFAIIAMVCYTNFSTVDAVSNSSTVFGTVGGIGFIVFYLALIGISMAYIVYNYIAAYRIFTHKAGENGIIWLIVDMLISNITTPIFMLVYMNKPAISNNN